MGPPPSKSIDACSAIVLSMDVVEMGWSIFCWNPELWKFLSRGSSEGSYRGFGMEIFKR